jgi:hypothetical protein
MMQQHEFERLLDLWFDEGPTVVSDRVIHVVADRIERQRQRPAWQFRLERRRAGLDLRIAALVAATVIVATIAFSLGGGFSMQLDGGPASATAGPVASAPPSTPKPTRSPRPTPTPRPQVPLTHTFTSSVNRYSIAYPDGWTVKPATQVFRWGSPLSIHDPTVDVFAPPDGRTAFYITSMAIPGGVTEEQWHLTQVQLRPDPTYVCPPVVDDRPGLTVHVGGVVGSASVGCGGIAYLTPIMNYRGYEFLLFPSPAGSVSDEELGNEDLFVAMLDSVALSPLTLERPGS